MKLTVLWMFLALTHVFARGYAQKISLNEKNISLAKVLNNIERQSGYVFIYKDLDLEKIKVSIQVTNVSIEQAVEASLKNQALTYKILDKSVLIKKDKASIADRVIDFFSRIDAKGKVVDENNQPLQGATVKVKGGALATITGNDGQFFLKGVPEDAIIVIMYLGYKPRELKASSVMGEIKLEQLPAELDEVTVSTGYWTTTKTLSTGNIAKVTAKEIENQPITSPLMALQGRVAGVDISPLTGTPGAASIIRIRGTNSLRNNNGHNRSYGADNDGNYPMYVIDGIPVSPIPLNRAGNQNMGNGYDPLSTINPENIASIEVLKDADATAIYGSRGANGVILITTKKNTKSSERSNVDIKIYRGAGQVSRKLDLLTTQQYLAMRREGIANDGRTAGENDVDLKFWDQSRYTDWQEVLLGGSSNITDFQGGISSGSKATSFNFGGAYHKETLITPGDFGYQRGSGNISLNHVSSNQKLRASASGSYGVEASNMYTGNLVEPALTLPPNAPLLYDANGDLNWERHEINGLLRSTWSNPLASQFNTYDALNRNLVIGGNLSYEFLKGVSVSSNLGLTDLTGTGKSRTPIISKAPEFYSTGGTASFAYNKRNSWIIEPKISFLKGWGHHNIDVVVGASWQLNMNSFTRNDGSNYTSDALLGSIGGAGTASTFERSSEYKYESQYGRIGYNFADKYLLNLTARRDGSSRFGPSNRYGNFGAVGAAWILSKEDLIRKMLPFISFGKLRGSYGITGSDNIGDYKYYNLYNPLGVKYQGIPGFVPDALYNPDYAWEETRKLEAAMELSFFKDRFSTEISWYRNRSSNQLVDYPLPATTGFPTVLQNFNAIVQNTGWEISLRGDILQSDAWTWIASINVTIPHNKLVKFDGIEDSPYATMYKVGEPLSIQWLYTYKGVNPQTGLYEILDRNADGVINDLDKSLMNALDKNLYGGFNNVIQYKSIDLSFLFQFSRKDAPRYFTSNMPGSGANQTPAVLDRWFTPGDKTDVQKYSSEGFIQQTQYLNVMQSDFNITDASFLRLKTMSIGWQLPPKWSDRAKLQHAKLFLQGHNLITVTRYKGLDPETGSAMPPLRMITGGIQITF